MGRPFFVALLPLTENKANAIILDTPRQNGQLAAKWQILIDLYREKGNI